MTRPRLGKLQTVRGPDMAIFTQSRFACSLHAARSDTWLSGTPCRSAWYTPGMRSRLQLDMPARCTRTLCVSGWLPGCRFLWLLTCDLCSLICLHHRSIGCFLNLRASNSRPIHVASHRARDAPRRIVSCRATLFHTTLHRTALHCIAAAAAEEGGDQTFKIVGRVKRQCTLDYVYPDGETEIAVQQDRIFATHKERKSHGRWCRVIYGAA